MTDIYIAYAVKRLSSGADTDAFTIRDEHGERAVQARFRDTKCGAWIEVEERTGPPGALVMLSLQLNEGGPDLLRARVDYHLGRKSPASILRPMRSFLCILARITHVPGPKRPAEPAAE